MSNMKAYTNIEQSKKLAEILPIESADMEYMFLKKDGSKVSNVPFIKDGFEEPECCYIFIPCWSLAALLDYIKDKCGYFHLYSSSTFNSRVNKLENVHRLSTDIYDVYENELVDACYEMILKLN